MRSDNLRPAPAFFTPDMVRRVLEQIGKPSIATPCPVEPLAPAKPKLRVVASRPGTDTRNATNDTAPSAQNDTSDTPVEHAWRTEEREAAAPVASPRRRKKTMAEKAVAFDAKRAEQTKSCVAEHRPDRQTGRRAAPREPAPHAPQPARAQPNPDRAKMDVANKRRSDAVRRRVVEKAEALLDSGKTVGKGTNVHVKIAVRAVEERRAEDARQACPIEQAKTILRRRYAPVVSMAVYEGDPDLYCVGHRKNLTKFELLELAARSAA